MRVLAAMSGGVDSSVAVARCVDAGHDVVGVHLALSRSAAVLRTGSRGCCSLEDAHDARRVADALGIPFYVWDFSDKFKEEVIDDFVETYARGFTPNPCVRCNEKIKFHALAQRAYALGFDAIATGHYARLHQGVLRRAVDLQKDQSYVLASLTQQQLERSLFPLGDTAKDMIRQEAHNRGFSVAKKPDSHDICFIPSGDTRAFLGAHIGMRPGAVIDSSTEEQVACHDGVFGFTIGQRKGLGLIGPGKDGAPRYVTAIDSQTNTVVIGTVDQLEVNYISVKSMVWHDQPERDAIYRIQVRAHGGVTTAKVTQYDDCTAQIELTVPLRGVARGQILVIYQVDEVYGDRVIAAGIIDAATAAHASVSA